MRLYITSVASVAECEAAERWPLLLYKGMLSNKLRAYVYVDGFNLFYGCLKKTSYKWLDINKLVTLYFPEYEIRKIKYFSAITKARKDDLNKPVRQLAYFRALKTLSNIQIILGTFLENEVSMFVPDKDRFDCRQEANVELNNKQVKLPLLGKNYLIVKKTEEKGSDVNLGTHLIMDAYEKNFDVAIVISNDSDLAEPIKISNKMSHVIMRLLNPYQSTNIKLQDAVKGNIKIIRKSTLQIAQFSDNITDVNGNISRPVDWK